MMVWMQCRAFQAGESLRSWWFAGGGGGDSGDAGDRGTVSGGR